MYRASEFKIIINNRWLSRILLTWSWLQPCSFRNQSILILCSYPVNYLLVFTAVENANCIFCWGSSFLCSPQSQLCQLWSSWDPQNALPRSTRWWCSVQLCGSLWCWPHWGPSWLWLSGLSYTDVRTAPAAPQVRTTNIRSSVLFYFIQFYELILHIREQHSPGSSAAESVTQWAKSCFKVFSALTRVSFLGKWWTICATKIMIYSPCLGLNAPAVVYFTSGQHVVFCVFIHQEYISLTVSGGSDTQSGYLRGAWRKWGCRQAGDEVWRSSQ